MSKEGIEIVFVVRKNPRRPYVKNLKTGTTKAVIEVTQEEMNERILPSVIEDYV